MPPKKMGKKDVAHIQAKTNTSQAVFARCLNVSAKTVQGWEQGLSKPSSAALRLLEIAEKHPEIVFSEK